MDVRSENRQVGDLPHIYRRLTGRRRTPIGYSQLWLGPDHILLLKSSRFTEEYRRFALADIQSIVVTSLPERTAIQVVAAGAALAWMLAMLAVSSIFAKAFFALTGTIALAWVISDIVRGQRCRCHLYTAVSRELLAPVLRIRAARAFLDRIRPEIESVQGMLAVETVVALAQPSGSPILDQPPEVPQAPGYLPETLFALFLADAALIWVNLRLPKTELSGILLTTFFAELLLTVVALVRRRSRDPRRVIYGLMIVVILCIGWDVVGLFQSFGSWYLLLMEAATHGKTAPQPTFSWTTRGATLFASGWRLAAGTIGLTAAYFERRKGSPK